MKSIFTFLNLSDKINFVVYWAMVSTFYLCYLLVFFGIYYINPDYIHVLSIAIQLFICGFLIWNFHPFKEHVLRPYDGKLIFAAGFFLFSNVVAVEIGTYVKNPMNYILTIYTFSHFKRPFYRAKK